MPDPRTFTVQQELRFFDDLQRINARNDAFRTAINPQLAKNVSNLFLNAPYAPKEVVFTAGRALTENKITQQDADDLVTGTQDKVLRSPITYKIPKPSVWDNIYGGIKSTVKWGIAGGSFLGDLAVNAGGSVIGSAYGAVSSYERYAATGEAPLDVIQTQPKYRGDATFALPTDLAGATVFRGAEITPGDITPDLATMFRSTQLGALLTGAESGNGWFIGDEALRLQNQAAAKWAGTIEGVPLTPGRGMALLATQPGTVPYNILASLADIGVQIAIPIAPKAPVIRGKLVSGLSQLDIAPALRVAGLAGADEVRPLIRSLAGLTDFETPFIARKQVGEFLDSTMGRYVMQRLANVTDYEDARQLFPKSSLDFRHKIVTSTDDTIRDVLESELGATRGLVDVRDVDLKRIDDLKRTMLNNGKSRWIGTERLAADRAGWEIALVTDDPALMTRSVDNLADYLTMLRLAPESKNTLINELADTLTNKPENFRTIANKIQDTVLEQISVQRGVPRPLLDATMSRFTELVDQYILFGQVGTDMGGAPMPMMFGLGDSRQAKQLGKAAKGAMTGTTKEGKEGFFLIPDGTAMTASEMRRIPLVLPDPDRVYRATSKFRWFFEKQPLRKNPEKWGDPNWWVSSLDFLQNKMWKRWTTMTGGFVLRNTMESMFRASMAPGLRSGPLHPIEWIGTAIHADGFGKFLGDIEGVPFIEYARGIGQKAYDEYTDAVFGGIRENFDSSLIERRAAQTGAWQLVVRDQPDLYRQMIKDNIQLLANDEFFRLMARGWDSQRIIDALNEGDQDIVTALKSLQNRHSNIRLWNAEAGAYETASVRYIDEAGNAVEENLKKYLDLYVRPRIDYMTAGDGRLKEIIMNGDRFGEFTWNGRAVKAFKTEIAGQSGELVAIDYSDEFGELIDEILANPNVAMKLPKAGKARVHAKPRGVPVAAERYWDRAADVWFGTLFTKPDAYLNRSAVWRKYYYMKIGDLLDELGPDEAASIRDAVRYGKAWNAKEDLRKILAVRPDADMMFQWGTGKVGIDGYLAEVDKYLADLGVDAAVRAKQIDRLEKVITLQPGKTNQVAKEIAEIGFTSVQGSDRFGARWVGSKELWQRILDKADGVTPSDGSFTAAEISQVAKSFAMDATKKVFFDSAKKGNMTEVMRIISPFGGAWAEQMRTWTRLLTGNPNKIKNAAVTADNLRGYFYNDPVTGEPYFNYGPLEVALPVLLGIAGVGAGALASTVARIPMAAAVPAGVAAGVTTGLVAGERTSEVSPQLVAPAKSFSMAFNVLPSVGPVFQVAASQLFNNTELIPNEKAAREFIAPFGAPTGAESFLPAWLRKISEVVTADPETDRVFATLAMDSFYTLMASGKYDRMNPEDVDRAWTKAKGIGKWLTFARGIGQMIGPGRPGVQMVVPTEYKDTKLEIGDIKQLVENGNVTNVTLSRVFRFLQNQDIDTAVPKFIEMFGENAMYYMVGRTTTAEGVGGLEASREFGEWEEANKGFADTHKSVYGFFAPIGDGFDKQTFIYQITSGRRVTRTDPFRAVADAEYILGSALHRQYQRELGADGELTKLDRTVLSEYRASLEEYFPGYKYREQVTNRTPTMIDAVVRAASDSRMAENQIAQTVLAYQEFRSWALDFAQTRRQAKGEAPAKNNILTGAANADLRAYLRDVGEQLIQNNPTFARVFDDVFYFEIDEVQ